LAVGAIRCVAESLLVGEETVEAGDELAEGFAGILDVRQPVQALLLLAKEPATEGLAIEGPACWFCVADERDGHGRLL
jgi:hypothetical protein